MSELRDRVVEYNKEIKEALKTVYDALNSGQKNKLLKDEKVKKIFEKYKVLE